jgi:hypothetical protein
MVIRGDVTGKIRNTSYATGVVLITAMSFGLYASLVLMPVLLVVGVTTFIGYLQLFGEPYVMTGGGPGTEVFGSGRAVTRELQFNDFRIIHVDNHFTGYDLRVIFQFVYRIDHTTRDTCSLQYSNRFINRPLGNPLFLSIPNRVYLSLE